MATSEFAIKDSGERQSFGSGMVRDTTEGKVNFLSVRFGPMLRRWADHLTKGRQKYPDVSPGVPNWTLAEGIEEYLRAKESAARHFEQWLGGDRDEDHAAAIYFNVNLAEYVLEQTGIDPGLGAKARPIQADTLRAEQDASLEPIRVSKVVLGGETRPYRSHCECEGCDCRFPHGHTGLSWVDTTKVDGA